MCVIRRHFWCVRADSGGDIFSRNTVARQVGPSSQGTNIFFRKIRRPFRWVPNVRWRNHYFARNKEAFPCVRSWTQLSASPRKVHFRCMSVVDHVDQAAPRAPGRWTTARPRKGMTRSRGRRGSGSPRGEEYEGSLVRLRCEPAVAAGPGQRWE